MGRLAHTFRSSGLSFERAMDVEVLYEENWRVAVVSGGAK